jgi:MYXO-CTERM domain-containing protein
MAHTIVGLVLLLAQALEAPPVAAESVRMPAAREGVANHSAKLPVQPAAEAGQAQPGTQSDEAPGEVLDPTSQQPLLTAEAARNPREVETTGGGASYRGCDCSVGGRSDGAPWAFCALAALFLALRRRFT